MKFGNLKSLGHNIADSLASSIGLMIGIYELYVFDEASSAPEGFIMVDFLNATTAGSKVSINLSQAVRLYNAALPKLCEKHKLSLSEIKVLEARYGTDPVYGCHFTVTVEAKKGKRSTDLYMGSPGKRYRGHTRKN